MARHDDYYLHLPSNRKTAGTLRAGRSGSNLSDSITAAVEMSRTRSRNVFGAVALEGDAKTWIIPAAELSNITTIRAGDRFDDGTNVWTFKQVTQSALGHQWICLSILNV